MDDLGGTPILGHFHMGVSDPVSPPLTVDKKSTSWYRHCAPKNIAMENDPFIDYFRIKTSIYLRDFPWLC